MAAEDRMRGDAQAEFDRDHRFRRCMGTYATGVTIVAVQHDGEYAGMTLNAFTSVSLTPLLVSVALAHETRTLALVNRSRRFSVSILESRQRDVAREFAVPGAPFPERFARADASGHVRIPGALAFLACDVSQQVTAGDHDIVVGQVTTFEDSAGTPLVFYGGDFGTLTRTCEAA